MASNTQTQTQTEAYPLPSTSEWESNAASAQSTAASPSHDEAPTDSPSIRLDRATTFKLISACFSFFVAGVNDGSIGALVPYMIRDYNITTAIVSSVYGAQLAGWMVAATTNTHLCQYLDLGVMLALGAVLQILAHALRAWMPPFPLFTVTFLLASLGQAFNDTHANTFVASTKGAYRWLALIHASYAAGCLVGPFAATGIASGSGSVTATAGMASRWYLFYTFPAGISVMNLAFIAYAFRDSLRLKSKPGSVVDQGGEVAAPAVSTNQDSAPESRSKDATKLIKETITRPSVLLLSLFYFFYIGSAITLGGWVVEYLVDVRDGDLSKMGFVPAGYQGGALLGRLLLAEPTHRLGERRMVFIYCLLACALHLVFWLVPNIIAASIAVSFIGFFTGPIFATGVSVGSKLFPPRIHSTALAFVFVSAQMGGSLFPIITGVVAARAGVHVLQPILMGIFVATAVSWLFVPRIKASDNAALHQE